MKRRWVLPAMIVFGAQVIHADDDDDERNAESTYGAEADKYRWRRLGTSCGYKRWGPTCGAVRLGSNCGSSVTQYGASCGIRQGVVCGIRIGSACRTRIGSSCEAPRQGSSCGSGWWEDDDDDD